MTAVFLALASAVGYGVSDFVVGVSSRHRSAWAVAVACQAVALLVLLVVAIGRLGDPTPVDLAWGVAAGIGNGVGTGFIFRGLGSGRMSVVAPVSAVGAAVLPVAAGLVVGERPSMLVWVGSSRRCPASASSRASSTIRPSPPPLWARRCGMGCSRGSASESSSPRSGRCPNRPGSSRCLSTRRSRWWRSSRLR